MLKRSLKIPYCQGNWYAKTLPYEGGALRLSGMLKTSIEIFKDGFVDGIAKYFFHN